jgi:hypothetical protein
MRFRPVRTLEGAGQRQAGLTRPCGSGGGGGYRVKRGQKMRRVVELSDVREESCSLPSPSDVMHALRSERWGTLLLSPGDARKRIGSHKLWRGLHRSRRHALQWRLQRRCRESLRRRCLRGHRLVDHSRDAQRPAATRLVSHPTGCVYTRHYLGAARSNSGPPTLVSPPAP